MTILGTRDGMSPRSGGSPRWSETESLVSLDLIQPRTDLPEPLGDGVRDAVWDEAAGGDLSRVRNGRLNRSILLQI